MATLLMVPAIGPVAAQGLPAPPRLEVSPPCGPVTPFAAVAFPTRLLISGRNFIPGQTLVIEFDSAAFRQPPPPVATVTVGPYGSFDQPVSIVLPSLFGTFSIFATDTANGDFVIRTTFDTPCRTFTITPNCGPAVDPPTDQVYDIKVEGKGFGLGVAVDLTFELNGESIGKRTRVVPDDQGEFSTDFPQQAVPTGLYHVRASQPAIEGPPIEAFAEFRTPCPAPTLVVDPPCGPAGSPPDLYQLTVSGTGFIPNRGIFFFFDPGPNTQIFVFNKDTPGTGILDPVPIDPFLRPSGTYDVVARQYDFDRVALEVHATFQVPCTAPELTIDPPDCGPPELLGDEPRTYDITVRGTGFAQGDVTIVFDADSTDPAYPPVPFTAPADGNGSFARALDPPRRPAGTYRIAALQKTRAGELTDSVTFRAPCTPPKPTLQRDPVCDREAPGEPDAYSIQLRLGGFIPGFVELIFDADGTPETEIAFVGENGRLTFTITPSGRAAGGYRIHARQQDVRQVLAERSVTFTVPCPTDRTPTLRIQPTSRAPGFVTFVDGTDFPPNTIVTLRWDRGVSVRRVITVQVDATGAFRKPVLIFRHDFAGVRQMTAGSEADPAAFPTASARFLVVAGQGSPPVLTFVDPFATGSGPPIVFRR